MQYIGFDIHKRYTFYTQMDASGQIQRQGKLTNNRDTLAEFFGKVTEPAQVVIEASMNWYHLYDLLEDLEIPVTLAHPLRTRAIAEAKVKTDKVDSTILAHLLRTDLVPAAYIPPREIRDLRELLRYRAALVKVQTTIKNRIHAILLKHGYQCPYSDAFGCQGRKWLSTLPLRPVYQQALAGFLSILDIVKAQIQAAAHTIDQEARATPIVEQLCSLPGVGHYTALLILAEIGDATRFPTPKHLVSYAGLPPVVHGTGGRVYTGHITKQGSRWLRWILIEAAMHASTRPSRFQQLYQRLAQRKGSKLARVVVARELLTTVYWMLRHAH
jgi:transposase